MSPPPKSSEEAGMANLAIITSHPTLRWNEGSCELAVINALLPPYKGKSLIEKEQQAHSFLFLPGRVRSSCPDWQEMEMRGGKR